MLRKQLFETLAKEGFITFHSHQRNTCNSIYPWDRCTKTDEYVVIGEETKKDYLLCNECYDDLVAFRKSVEKV